MWFRKRKLASSVLAGVLSAGLVAAASAGDDDDEDERKKCNIQRVTFLEWDLIGDSPLLKRFQELAGPTSGENGLSSQHITPRDNGFLFIQGNNFDDDQGGTFAKLKLCGRKSVGLGLHDDGNFYLIALWPLFVGDLIEQYSNLNATNGGYANVERVCELDLKLLEIHGGRENDRFAPSRRDRNESWYSCNRWPVQTPTPLGVRAMPVIFPGAAASEESSTFTLEDLIPEGVDLSNIVEITDDD